MLWHSDDVFHLSIADSFRTDKTFNNNYISTRLSENISSEYILNNVIPFPNNPQGSKGPIYYILLGTFFELFSTSQDDLFIHASFFNNFLALIFTILFFFFVKKTFNLKIAIISSILVTLIPGFTAMAVGITLEPLAYIFLLSSLFFLKNKNSNYVLFGIFAGLAHLTHPLSMTLIASYLIFLLFKKEFKGFLIVFGVWIIILLPWLIRNFYTFSDIGKGLFIPFSTKISELFAMLFSMNVTIPCCDQVNSFEILKITSFSNMVEGTSEFMYFLNSQILIIFIIVFAGISFFSLNQLKNNSRYIPAVIFTIFGICYLIFFNYKNEVILQLFFLFVLPTIAIFITYKKRRHLFSMSISRFQVFSIVYLCIHMLALYYISMMMGWPNVSMRFVLFHILLFIPLALYGFENTIKEKVSKIERKQKIMPVLLITLILSPIVINLIDGQELLQSQEHILQTPQIIEINHRIKENISPEKIIASNYPEEVWLETGLKSISLPNNIGNQEKFEEYINNFNISYVVLYPNIDPSHKGTDFSKKLTDFMPSDIAYVQQTIGDSSIIEVVHVLEADISNPFHYAMKVQRLIQIDKMDEAKTAIMQLRNQNFDDRTIEKMCDSFTNIRYYEDSIYNCEKILEKYPSNLIALQNLAVSYNEIKQKEKVIEIINRYDKLFEETGYMPWSELGKSWIKTVNYLTQDSYYWQITKAISIKHFEKYDGLLINEYDLDIKLYRDEIKRLVELKQYDAAKDIEKKMIERMNAQILANVGQDDNYVLSIYLEMVNIDKFNPTIYMKIAEHYEKEGSLSLAIHNYELSSQFDPENNYLIEKIEELKSKK